MANIETQGSGKLRGATAIITARGGSKRVPRKNLAHINGKNLVERSIEHAIWTPSVGNVILSSDSDEILAVASGYGGQVICHKRKPEFCEDDTTHEYALRNIIFENNESVSNIVVLLQPTSPWRNPLVLDEVIMRVASGNSRSAVSVSQGAVRHYSLSGDASTINMPLGYENGMFWVFRKMDLLSVGQIRLPPVGLFLTHPVYSMQIDTDVDLSIAQSLGPALDDWMQEHIQATSIVGEEELDNEGMD